MDIPAINKARQDIATSLFAVEAAHPGDPLVADLHAKLFAGDTLLAAQPEMQGGAHPLDGGTPKDKQ